MRRILLLVALLPVGMAVSGCGPILSTYLIVDAEAKLAGAKAAEADRYAIYEYTASDEYLKKAHEELGYADYGPAIDYAYKAADLAQQGTERANAERHKQVDEPGPATLQEAPTTTTDAPPPKKVIIKKLDVPSVPASDPSTQNQPKSPK